MNLSKNIAQYDNIICLIDITVRRYNQTCLVMSIFSSREKRITRIRHAWSSAIKIIVARNPGALSNFKRILSFVKTWWMGKR